MLAQINSLPRTQIEAAGSNGNGQKTAENRCLEMSRHIVRTFRGVAVIRRVLRGKLVEVTFKISAHGGVGIFVEGQAGRGVVEENVSQSNLNLFNIRRVGFDQMSNHVKTAPKWR